MKKHQMTIPQFFIHPHDSIRDLQHTSGPGVADHADLNSVDMQSHGGADHADLNASHMQSHGLTADMAAAPVNEQGKENEGEQEAGAGFPQVQALASIEQQYSCNHAWSCWVCKPIFNRCVHLNFGDFVCNSPGAAMCQNLTCFLYHLDCHFS